MKRYKSLFLLFLSALMAAGLASCEKIVEFDPGNIEPKVVMISRSETDTNVHVFLHYSRFFLDEHDFPAIEDATLVLDVNGTKLMAQYDRAGEYDINYKPMPGDTMTLTALVPGRVEPVVAGTRVPEMPDVAVHDFVVDTTGYYEYYYRIRFGLTAPNDECYYTLRVGVPSYDVDTAGNIILDTSILYYMTFSATDPLLGDDYDLSELFDGGGGEFWGTEAVFSSELFQDGAHEFSINMQYYFDSYYNGERYLSARPDLAEFPVYLEVRAISPELYRYERTNVSQNTFDMLLSEPVQVICNVEGGIGVFGSRSKLKLKLTEPRHENFHSDDYYYKKGGRK